MRLLVKTGLGEFLVVGAQEKQESPIVFEIHLTHGLGNQMDRNPEYGSDTLHVD